MSKRTESLRQFHEAGKSFRLTPTTSIHQNDIFRKLRGGDQTIAGIPGDSTDYRAQLKKPRQEEKLTITRSIALKLLARRCD
jgi:hypothetical protein